VVVFQPEVGRVAFGWHVQASHPPCTGWLCAVAELLFAPCALSYALCSWFAQEYAQESGRIDVRQHSVVIDVETTTNKDGEQRFGFRLVPASGRQFVLQASSPEERHLWAMAIDQVTHPNTTRYDGGMGRVLKVKRPARPAKLGLDLGSSSGLPAVSVLRISGELASSGLYSGDCVLAVNNVVLRNSLVAARAFQKEEPEMTLQLLGWNREVKIVKHAGVAGLVCCSPSRGPGVLVSSVAKDGAAAEAGLHIGDRLLAINNEVRHCTRCAACGISIVRHRPTGCGERRTLRRPTQQVLTRRACTWA